MITINTNIDGKHVKELEIRPTHEHKNLIQNWLKSFPTRSKRIDVMARIFFPIMFALFNLVYWSTYMFREDLRDL